MSNTHVMIDIETLGTRTSSIVLSIAAVRFRMDTGEILHKFIAHPSIYEQEAAGRTLSASTMAFHMNSKAQRAEFEAITNPYNIQQPVTHSLLKFSEFLNPKRMKGPELKWCRGASFDFPILKSLFEMFPGEVNPIQYGYPWKHREEMCMRPILAASPEGPSSRTPDVGTAHEAMSDCLYQINLLRNCLKDLNLLSRFCGGDEGNA